MHASEIHNQVLLGSHKAVKAFLQTVIIDRVGGEYDGSGKVIVRTTTRVEAFQWANAAQETLGAAFKVTYPVATFADCGFYSVRDGYMFTIAVR